MRILLIEPDEITLQATELMLKSVDFQVYPVNLGEDGLDLAKTYPYDIIVTETALPDLGSGASIVARLRNSKVTTPILVLSSHDKIHDRIHTLNVGADGFLSKVNLDREELVANVLAIVRRSKGYAASIITIGELAINLTTQSVTHGGAYIHLTIKEYKMLEALALRQGNVVTKEMLLDHLYGGMDERRVLMQDTP